MRTPGMLLAQLEASVAGAEVGVSLAQLAVVSCAEPEAHGQGQLRVRVGGLELDVALRGDLKIFVGLAGHMRLSQTLRPPVKRTPPLPDGLLAGM